MNPPVKLLQNYLKDLSLHGLLVPKMDPHRCEFTLDHDNYLKFVTGFTGSSGFSVVLADSAAIFVDGRYTLQADEEVDAKYFSHHEYTYNAICNWIQHNMRPNQTLVYDPLLFSEQELRYFIPCCQKAQINLTEVAHNPIDHIWINRPIEEKPALDVHPLEYSGEHHENKIKKICEVIKQSNAHGVFLNIPETIAWLLNIRSPERPYTPAASAFFYLSADRQGVLFINEKQVPDPVRIHLGNSLVIKPYTEVFSYLSEIAPGKAIMLDPSESPVKAVNMIQARGGRIIRSPNPCQMLKARKNSIEIQGARNAQVRDGAALVNFLAWLYQSGLNKGVTEREAAKKLLDFRQQQPLFIGISFETIAASGPNGAIVHYRAHASTNRLLTDQELFLLDSGGQYLDGTTDITRTVSLNGNPSPEQKDRFTRVLKGHIALAKVRFPLGTTGSRLDALARQFLWEIGCDYAHGTGHGVGSYLGVHEGPQSISSRPNSTPLEPGMILSNEPGYYKAHEYGIRIENLVVVKSLESSDQESKMYGFDTLSVVPIDIALIEMALLTPIEREWVNQYHKRVRETLMPYVEANSIPWLMSATQEI